MGVGSGCIYYNSRQGVDFEEIVDFFEKAGFYLKHPETKKIITVDREGESYTISYQKLCHQFCHNNRFVVKLWQDDYYYLFCNFTVFANLFAFATSFHSFYFDEQIKKAAKVFVDFFFEQLPKNKAIIGMYVDKFAKTEDIIDWDDFFQKPDMITTILPDILCVKQEKSINIKVEHYNYITKIIDERFLAIENLS